MYSKALIVSVGILVGCGLAAVCLGGSTSRAVATSIAVASAYSALPPPDLSCAALTAAKASEVLHEKMTVTVDTSAGDGKSNCTYTYSTGGRAKAYVVIGADARRTYEATKSGVTEATEVKGVGDNAFDSEQGFNAIQGDHYVGVVGTTPKDPTGKRRLAVAMLAALRTSN